MRNWLGLSAVKDAALRAKPVQKGVVSATQTVPSHIQKPDYAATGRPYNSSHIMALYTKDEIAGVRKAAQLARKMLEFSKSLVTPGITTDEIDKRTHEQILSHGAYPTPLNYYSFPKSICTSVNDVACHGIPDDRPLEEGDIISIDVSLFTGGFHGDNCGTVVVGKADPALDTLIAATDKAVMNAIESCHPGECLTAIGGVIQETAEEEGFSVVPNFCGHGTGRYIHMAPLVLHYKNREVLPLRPGMVFTIEPILCEGKGDIFTWRDGWTAATKDGSWSAQIEHEVLITETGVEILTALD